jgi:hypothetical protein
MLTSALTMATQTSKGEAMKLTLLGTDSEDGDSPTAYVTDRGTYVVQGWRITDL